MVFLTFSHPILKNVRSMHYKMINVVVCTQLCSSGVFNSEHSHETSLESTERSKAPSRLTSPPFWSIVKADK